MKDNVKEKLFYLNIGANESNTFMEDIFGIQIGQSKRAGLVDCMSEDAFDQMLDSLKDEWCNRHPNGEEFYQYFITYKSPCYFIHLFLLLLSFIYLFIYLFIESMVILFDIQLWYQCTFKIVAFIVFHNVNIILAFSNNVNVILAFLYHFLLNSPDFSFLLPFPVNYLMKGVIPKYVIERKLLCRF